MNELTITGNLTDEPTLHYTPGGAAILTLTVAVNDRRFDRGRGQWVDRPAVFHRVVAFRGLAENAANLAKGTAVTVTGKLADDSWTPEDSGRKIYRTVLEAEDIAVSLRFATAEVTKVRREQHADDRGGDAEINMANPGE
jgi:single-strand DNA-binding protein